MTNRDKDDLLDKVEDLEYDLQSLLEEIKSAIKDEKTISDLDTWKMKVVQSMPEQCSMATRIKVEEFLETIQP